MKKQIKNLILFLIFANLQGAFSYTLTSNELKETLNIKVKRELSQILKEYSSNFTFNISGIPNADVITNENTKPTIEIESQNRNFSSNLYRRVLIKTSNGNLIKSFPINVQTRVYKEVLVASETIPFDSEINTNNSRLEKREISKYLGKTFSNNSINLISKRNYPKGAIIVSNYTKQKSLILKNSDIDIIFKSNNLNIKVKGTALKEGSKGETILVRSEKYNKTYNAVVLSQNEAMVRI